jgi:type IX secretion system PorP/SprF family membrane protein
MTMLKRSIYSLVLTLMVSVAFGQDLTFSQFYENALLRNPALAGVFEGDIRLVGTFRNQWQNVTVPFQTTAFSTEVKFPFGKHNDWITAGVQITQDAAGDIKLKRTQLLPVINFHKSLSGDNDNYLSVAFMGGPVRSQFDPTQLKVDDQFQGGVYNPNLPTNAIFATTGFTYWDFSAGISYSSSFGNGNKYYLGAGMFHINKPLVGFYTNSATSALNRKITLNAGLSVPTNDYSKVVFYGDYFSQGGNQQFLGGLMYGTDLVQGIGYDSYENVTLYGGAFYRWGDALIPVVKLDIHQFTVGVSYDANVSQLQTASQSRGGFEFTATYRAKFRNRSNAGDKVRCVSGF